ncbi:MAG: hypothetical protein AAF601_11770 [Pseudomonadota bacterium]
MAWLAGLLGPSGEVVDEVGTRADAAMDTQLRVLDKDPYLAVADSALRLISVFDDLKYDRSDADMLSGPMRQRVVQALKPLGFVQRTGSMIENREAGVRMHLPKSHALGASPFDVTRYTARQPQDYFILTPTQAAARIIDQYDTDTAVERIKALIARQPINLMRLVDHLERKDSHAAFGRAVGHLKYVQREAVESDPLRTRRALR